MKHQEKYPESLHLHSITIPSCCVLHIGQKYAHPTLRNYLSLNYFCEKVSFELAVTLLQEWGSYFK